MLQVEMNKRLERLCICPVTKWLLFKEKLARFNSVFCRIERGLRILCCPPLCYILPQVAFWPPPNEYFFYMDNGPPRIRKEIEGYEDAIEIARRKKKFLKVYRADKFCEMSLHQKTAYMLFFSRKTWLQTGWRIGHQHPCADDIDNVEGFIYIACVRIPTYGHSRYSILYSHPNASDLSDHIIGVPNLIDIARFYKSDVYSYDYSGFGISSGHASESNLKADIRAIYDHLLNDRGIEPNRIILMGYSIGCFASVHLACTAPYPPAGVVLQAPPTSVLRVLLWDRACFKKPFSNRSCCADRFSTYDMVCLDSSPNKICKIRVPVLVVHGEDDRKVPIVHGKAVCERAVKRVAPLWLRATHDNIENCRATWIRIRTFMKYELNKE
ncbi:hypothetical protein DICVIV_09243 [Dictyocaulus viviparus]|uniref:Peptidase S9 prolyl oligopeptidase catalytic domain-containing protein n=1 Tax=Dictyocaulus viviparus TaxID=29172 RepID=A0A0D8XLR3_DICVI|nr:hypothetical protein DICVIV_09243 [Dictyocaulus viviparus]